MRAFRRTLCAVDLTPASRRVVDVAIALARSQSGEVTFLHVLAPPVTPDAYEYLPDRMYEEMAAYLRRRAEKRLAAIVRRAAARKVRARTALAEGLVDEAILRAARRLKADVLVVGTHGRKGIAKFLIGSVASKVVANAPCPVLSVRSVAR
jgi:nucleotide-binding universal stress UspA family protein